MFTQHRFRFSAYSLYLFIVALGAFSLSMITTISMVYQIKTVGLNAIQLVLVGTVLELACFLSQVPTGLLADIYSRRLSVIAGYMLMGLGFLLEGLWPTFTAMLLAQVLWGIGATFVSGAEEAWIAAEVGEEQVGQVFMRGTQIGQVAALLSLPLSIWLATYRLNLPIIVGSCLFLVLGFSLLIFMPEHHFQPIPRAERSSWQTLLKTMSGGLRIVRHSRILGFIFAITVFQAMASEGFDRLNTAHFINDYTFPTFGHLVPLIWFGIISAGAMLLTLAATELVRRYVNLNNHHAIVVTMFVFNVLLIASVALFALARNFPLALCAFWCATICRRAVSPLYTTWITRNSDPKMRATLISMFGQVDAIGQIAGGPVVGWIGTIASLRTALLATCAILSPSMLFFARALPISKQLPFLSSPIDAENGKSE